MSLADQQYVDPRGARFAAWITAAVLAAVILTGSGWLLAAQTAVFLLGAVAGMRYSPYGAVFRLVRATLRIGPPAELEAAAPLRFAQALGAVFAVAGVIGFLAGSPLAGTLATAAALAAAFLNAAFGVCLGCEVYLIVRRISGRDALTRFVPARTTVERSSA
jgi:hypothetical protein